MDVKLRRSEAREAAFLLVYQSAFRTDSMNDILESTVEDEDDSFPVDDFARKLALLCEEKSEELDAVINRYLNRWKLNRLPRLTLAALRIAVCELLYFPDIPVAVTINEAIELLKKYASEEDAAFLNGVLGSVAKNEPIEKNVESKDGE